jgi:pSer/pThr/pTyr-binding forkhead associated (FHA) protein
MIKCGECGYENMDGLDYCDGCGAKLAAGAGAPAAGSSEAPATGATAEQAAPEPASPVASEAPTGEIKPEPAATADGGAAAPAAEAPAPSGAVPQFKAKLQVIRGGRKGQEFPLEDGNNFIGRWDPETGAFPEVDLEQDDPEAKISRKHALLRLEGGKITVEDIGSLNGTYVNRQPRLQPGSPVELKSGDEIIIGKTFLKLVVEPVS